MSVTRILIADDRPENIFTLESILEESNRLFLCATSGSETLIMCSIEKIDLILLDYQLGDMHGLDVARSLRKDESTKHIPIIFVSAVSKEARQELREFEEGTVDFLFKPLDVDEARIKIAVFERIIKLTRINRPDNAVSTTQSENK